MNITSMIAIYFLFWVMSAFLMLPFGVKTAHDVGAEIEPGHADSAPVNFRPWRVVVRATVLAAVLTGLFVVNYSAEWVTMEDIDWLPQPPASAR